MHINSQGRLRYQKCRRPDGTGNLNRCVIYTVIQLICIICSNNESQLLSYLNIFGFDSVML